MATKPLSSKEAQEVRQLIIKRRLGLMMKSHAKSFALLLKAWLRGSKE
ncbi:MAG: hypothetical protein AB7U80_08490 [Wolinella sp.]